MSRHSASRRFRRPSRLRTLPALAIVLPLGGGEPAPSPGAPEPVPAQIVGDADATAALGAVLIDGPVPLACARVLVRADGPLGDEAGARPPFETVEWRSVGRHAEVGPLRLERRGASTAAPGFDLWDGCAEVPVGMTEGRLFLSLAEPAPGSTPSPRRIASVEIRPEIWSWRPLRAAAAPLAAARGAAPVRPGSEGGERAPSDPEAEPAAPRSGGA
jgi:hypothetical protein